MIDFKNKPNTDTPINDKNLNANFKELQNELLFKDGDVFEPGTIFSGGLLTSSTKKIATSIFLPKSLKNISSITINNYAIAVRKDNGGYLVNVGMDAFDGSLRVTIASENCITLEFISNNALDGTNNTPIGIELMNLSLTFNE